MKLELAIHTALLVVAVGAALTCSSNTSSRDVGTGAADQSQQKDSALSTDRSMVDTSGKPDQRSADSDKAFVPIDYGTIASCSQLSTNSCFSNYECAADRRCQNLASEDSPVPCCVPGPRGTKNAGETCSGQLDCVSGVCIEKWNSTEPPLCSKTCTGEGDCPDKMKKCVVMVQSGTTDKWCFPE